MLNEMPRTMLVDMNSFFASVEQQANPFLRGKPVGICASLHETSCIIGTSKELKAMGITNGAPTYKAKKVCPKIILLQAEPEKYRAVNHKIVKIFRDYTDRVEVYSVDEAFLQMSDSRYPADAKALAGRQMSDILSIGAEIKRRIKAEVGEWLTCSVGVAQNKFLCKLAADMQKPDGLSILWRDQLPEIYKNKKLKDLWGINHGWTRRLEKLGIVNPGQLLDYPVQNLIALFGKPGFHIWQRVNGLEVDTLCSSPLTGEDVTLVTDEGDFSYPSPGVSRHPLPQGEREILKETSPKSFGHSWVLNFRTTDKEKLKIVILRLAEKASRRMRREGFIANGMYLSITQVDGIYFRRSKKLKFKIETGLQLYQQALKTWQPWRFTAEVMHIAVGYTHLQIKFSQLSLFSDKFLKLTATMDDINDKYGEFTIRSALLAETADFAPDAIAFGR